MKHLVISILFLTIYSLSATTAVAMEGQTQEVVFGINKMTCPACPITVRKAMERVDGVNEVKVDLETKTVTVIFDPALTNVEQIAEASSNVGFPAVFHQGNTQ